MFKPQFDSLKSAVRHAALRSCGLHLRVRIATARAALKRLVIAGYDRARAIAPRYGPSLIEADHWLMRRLAMDVEVDLGISKLVIVSSNSASRFARWRDDQP